MELAPCLSATLIPLIHLIAFILNIKEPSLYFVTWSSDDLYCDLYYWWLMHQMDWFNYACCLLWDLLEIYTSISIHYKWEVCQCRPPITYWPITRSIIIMAYCPMGLYTIGLLCIVRTNNFHCFGFTILVTHLFVVFHQWFVCAEFEDKKGPNEFTICLAFKWFPCVFKCRVDFLKRGIGFSWITLLCMFRVRYLVFYTCCL